nr:hypothetical protein Iba_chr05aCG15260 [Ipomoea batatas]GMC98354.1 hypothetical protein Iba_chr05dCG15770 [Ipomoea batatas]
MESRLRRRWPKVGKADHEVGHDSGSPTVIGYNTGYRSHEEAQLGRHLHRPVLVRITSKVKTGHL